MSTKSKKEILSKGERNKKKVDNNKAKIEDLEKGKNKLPTNL